MVIFWGRPAADCRFHRRSAYHLPQPSFTITAVFFCNLWAMLPSPGGLTRTSLLSLAVLPGCYGVFLPGDCALLRWAVRGGPTATSLCWPLAELATQLRTLPTKPAVSTTVHCPATPLSPPGVLLQPHLFAGLWLSFFRGSLHLRTRPRGAY